MKRISLILPFSSADSISDAWISRCRDILEADGSTVEVVVVLPKGVDGSKLPARYAATWTRVPRDGLVASMIQGLTTSHGDIRVVLDPSNGYVPEDLVALLAPLRRGEADLVVARRPPSTLAESLLAAVSKPVLKASDPLSGLVAMTSEKASEVPGLFEPVGSRFTIDLLLRLDARKAEVPVRIEEPSARTMIGLDDLRHIKRLADDHYGNISRLLQFCVIGASGMVVDLTCYAILQLLFAKTPLASWKTPGFESSMDLAAAAALAIGVALTWNFSLNRRLTFSYARHGSIVRQYLTYALSNALGIGLSFTLRLYLPARIDFFQRHRLAAAVVGIVAATGISFSMARWLVFRPLRQATAEMGGGGEPASPPVELEPTTLA